MGIEDQIIQKFEHQKLYEAIKKLPSHYQDIIYLKQSDLADQEIGYILGFTVPGVKSLHHRALAKLRKTLTPPE